MIDIIIYTYDLDYYIWFRLLLLLSLNLIEDNKEIELKWNDIEYYSKEYTQKNVQN